MGKESQQSANPVCELRIVYPKSEKEVPHTIRDFPCTIGRSSSCDLVISHPSVSSRHARLELHDDNIKLLDLNSTNGIFMGTERLEEFTVDRPCKLRFGDVSIYLNPLEEGAETSGEAAAADAGESAGAEGSEQEQGGKYYYRREGEQLGPHTRPQLAALARDGQLSSTDEVWLPETERWVPAESVPGIFRKRGPGTDPATAFAAKSAAEAEAIPRHQQVASKRGRNVDIVCPHCWHQFAVEDFLYIASHQSLVGDPVLGADAQQRFRPSKFTPEGNAIDSMGMSCPDMACPRCHLRIPQTASEKPPLFLSIIGATGSGKSFLLTVMLWQLRQTLSQNFAITFRDTDAINNQIVNEFEETLFLAPDSNDLVTLRKTELQGELYNQVQLEDMMVNLPRPFMFTLTPAEHHPRYEKVKAKLSRTLILYDNAGEHFEPGMDSVDNPTTHHILYSDSCFFLFDPTKDARFRRRLRGEDPQLSKGNRVQRQEILLTEMINRYKKYSGMREGDKTDRTLIIIVSKSDVWLDQLGLEVPAEPYQWDPGSHTYALDINTIKNTSFATRALLNEVCPEMVSTTESFARITRRP